MKAKSVSSKMPDTLFWRTTSRLKNRNPLSDQRETGSLQPINALLMNAIAALTCMFQKDQWQNIRLLKMVCDQ
ncbi:MAG: hypothetical protein WAR39_00685 [Prevotella sp.]